MNSKRVKRVHKTIEFYQRNFGFHAPYNILIDGTFCKAALEAKINIKEQLPKYLSSEVNIVTTQCVIVEIEKLSKFLKNLYGAWLVVKQFPIHQCGHKNDLKSATKCINSLLEKKNPYRYIVATMDDDLREYIRSQVLGTPIIYLHNKTPTIEKPPAAENFLNNRVSENYELTILNEIKTKVLGEQENLSKKKKKRNRDPNPLSCLKSKKQKVEITKNPLSKRKRRKNNKQIDILSSIKNVFETEIK